MTDPEQRRAGAGAGRAGGAASALGSLGLGLVWAVSAAGFALVGAWLDGRLGTGRVLTLVGALVGAVAGFGYLYHHAVAAPRAGRGARR